MSQFRKMTIIPLSQSLPLRSSFSPNLPTVTAAVRSLSASLPNIIMAEHAEPNSQISPKTLANYPKPISPPLPAISKDVEQSRAMSACSRSSLFSLRRGDILFEDQWLMAVNKPQGVYSETILSSANRMLNRSEGHDSSGSLHLGNRLDRDTSGVMVITKSHQAAAKLMKAFSSRLVTKTYIALCIGPAPKWRTVTVKSGHGRSKFGAWRVYATSDVGRALPNAPPVKDMGTSFEVLSVNCQGSFKELPEEPRKDEKDDEEEDNVIVVEERLELGSNGDAEQDEILVRAFPRSGRTHQIRLHCQYLGMPIRGDVKYEGVHEWKGKVYDGHELHAESLSFEHPVTGVAVTFRAPLPPWAVQALPPSSSHQCGNKMVSQYEAPCTL